MNKKVLFLFVMGLMLNACNEPSNVADVEIQNSNTTWRGVIQLNNVIELPFNFEWQDDGERVQMTIKNGKERISSTSVTPVGDSLKVEFPVFANYFMLKVEDSIMNGTYVNPDAKDYILPMYANQGDTSRFTSSESACCDVNGKWAVQFSPDTEDEYPAIAYFDQSGDQVTGTFVTETGDYRFLEGNIDGRHLQLSTFDGAHLFLFSAQIDPNGNLNGSFFSGRHWMEPWVGFRNDDFELRDADSLTYLKEGYTKLEFSFPDANGNAISLSDSSYLNKPVIVQIMGSWCPNCMDESRYLKQVYDQYHEKGLEIISLAFERSDDPEKAFKRINKLKKDLELPYPIALAGVSNKKEAAKALPMLNHVMSYPTAIYLDKDHNIKKIHTGFSGPGTPLYDKYVAENKILLEQLVEQ